VLVGAWVARHLGPELFGSLSYALALVALFQAIGKLGLDTIVVRDLARADAAAAEILGTTLRLRLLAGAALWAISILAAYVLNVAQPTIVLLVGIVGCGALFQAVDTIDLWFQSRHESRKTVVPKLIAHLLTNGLRVVAIVLNATIEVFAILVAAELAAGALLLFLSYRRSGTSMSWKWSAARAAGLLAESWPLLLSGVAIMIYSRIDHVVLGHLRGPEDLGIYAAALTIAEAWNFIPMLVAISVAPALSRLRSLDPAQYQLRFTQLLRIVGVSTLLVAVITAIASPWLVAILFGDPYSRAVDVLRVAVFALPFLSLGVLTSLWLTNERMTKVALGRAAFGAIVKIATTVLLVPYYGAMGAAIATVITQFCAAVLYHAFLRTTRQLFFAQCKGLLGV
jgi:PST family polysaccharide transporter